MLNFISSSPMQPLVIAGASCVLTAAVMKHGSGEVAQSVLNFMFHPIIRLTTIITSGVLGYQYYACPPVQSLLITAATYAFIQEIKECSEGEIIEGEGREITQSVKTAAINFLSKLVITKVIIDLSGYVALQSILQGAAIGLLTREVTDNGRESLRSLIPAINCPMAHPVKAICSMIIIGNLMEIVLNHSSRSSFLIAAATNIATSGVISAMIIYGPGKVAKSVLTVMATAMTISTGIVTGGVIGIVIGMTALINTYNTNQAEFHQIHAQLQAGSYGTAMLHAWQRVFTI